MSKISNSIIVSVLLALCLGSLIEASLKIYPCKNVKSLATIKKLDIAKSQNYPVKLARGENATISIDFQTTSKITACKLKIFGELNGKTVPFSAANDDNHCHESIKELKGKKNFVLLKNKPYSYTFSFTNSFHFNFHTIIHFTVVFSYTKNNHFHSITAIGFPLK